MAVIRKRVYRCSDCGKMTTDPDPAACVCKQQQSTTIHRGTCSRCKAPGVLLHQRGSDFICKLCIDSPDETKQRIFKVDDPFVCPYEVIDANGLKWDYITSVNLDTGEVTQCVVDENGEPVDRAEVVFTVPIPIFLRPIT